MIYFDNAATTKPSIEALEFAEKFNREYFFNPSALYREGINVSKEIKNSKNVILRSLGLSTDKYDVIFTASGTESDNTAIFCSVKRGCFVTDKGEHSAVYKSFLELKQQGKIVHFVDLLKSGEINKDLLYDYVRHNAVDFLSIMHVNNETGAVNDINDIADHVKKINPNIIIHCDGVQSFGKIPYKMSDKIDFYSISAHKINALKGVGALIRKKRVNLTPLIHGGGQEDGFRSGTENVFGIKVFEHAIVNHYMNLSLNFNNVKEINNYIRNNLDKGCFNILSSENSSPYILSISAIGLKGEVLMHCLEQEGIIVGNGSACSSRNRFSRVVEACGYNKEVLDGVIRLSFSHENTIEEAKTVVNTLNVLAKKLKGIMIK